MSDRPTMVRTRMKGKIVVITGGTRGFGYAIAESLLSAGATVVICGRSKASLRRAEAALHSPELLSGVVCDVRKEAQVYSLARHVLRRFRRIDVWINNAGYSASAGMILDTPPRHAAEMFLTNDMGVLHGSRAALDSMLKRKAGTLVTIYGNGSFLRPASPTALYGATKAWATSFTRSLAKEIRGSGVKIVGFSPGMLKNYGVVLRLLASPPSKAAARLVKVLETDRGEFVEYRLFKAWTPLLGLLRMAWENLRGTGHVPTYTLKLEPAYKPKS
jgi:NAD(P)-dependent dehydrogenase (short-subunit alcohol dehydrogenase family)